MSKGPTKTGGLPLRVAVLYLIAGIVFVVGVVFVVGAFPAAPGFGVTTWPIEVVSIGATLMIGALAAAIAMHATVSWAEQRKRDVEREVWKIRADYYDKVIVAAVQQFVVDKIDKESLAEQRAHIALWASSDVASALDAWASESLRIARLSADGSVPAFEQPNLRAALFQLIQAMRSELPDAGSSLKLSNDELAGIIFDDHRPHIKFPAERPVFQPAG